MDNQNNVVSNTAMVEKKKFNSFIVYAILTGIMAACVFIGPIVFIILGTASEVNADGKAYNPLEKQYILSVCIVTLIVCGIALILVVSSLVYKMLNKKKKVEA